MGGLFGKERNAGWLIYFLTSPVFLGLDILLRVEVIERLLVAGGVLRNLQRTPYWVCLKEWNFK